MTLNLASEKLEISQSMLSKYCFSIAKEYGIKIGGDNKLVPNLIIKDNKSKYVAHYKNLQLYLLLGMKRAKVNRILIQTKGKIHLIVLKKIF